MLHNDLVYPRSLRRDRCFDFRLCVRTKFVEFFLVKKIVSACSKVEDRDEEGNETPAHARGSGARRLSYRCPCGLQERLTRLDKDRVIPKALSLGFVRDGY